MNKTDIYEKLLDATMNSMSYEIVEDYIYHLASPKALLERTRDLAKGPFFVSSI